MIKDIKDILMKDVDHTYIPASKYISKKGHNLPRVTSVINEMIHSDVLMYWANSLGFKGTRYKDFMSEAAKAGTEAHHRIELFLKDKLDSTDNIPYLGFKEWYYNIMNGGHIFEVLGSEVELTCEWYAGTCDAVVAIDGRNFLIDFKTSNHVTYKYFLQLAAYKNILETNGIKIDGVIVLQLYKDEVGFNEYILDFNNLNHLAFINECTNTFFSLLYGYYNIHKIESLFREIYGDNT